MNPEKKVMEIDPLELGPGVHWVVAADGEGQAAQMDRLLRDYGPLWQVRWSDFSCR